MSNLIFIGLDVDDKAFHGHAIFGETKEIIPFTCKPRASKLIEKLSEICPDFSRFRVCYEAGYLGFTLSRTLQEKGIHCDVIAPHLIPRINPHVKTDRIDSRNLTILYSKGMLQSVHIPESSEEAVRDLLRARHYLAERLLGIRNYILSLCRRSNLHFKQETEYRAHWTKAHLSWLREAIKELDSSRFFVINELLKEYEAETKRIEEFDSKIALLAMENHYQEKVSSLVCYRGFSTLAAMTVVVEVGDIHRFSHPRQLMGYAGLGIREFSSGGKEIKFGITKSGNRLLRKTLVESSQKVIRAPRQGQDLKRRRKVVHERYIKIADRCMVRLNKKGMRMIMRGKHSNSAKTACAREMLGFVWESLRTAQSIQTTGAMISQ